MVKKIAETAGDNTVAVNVTWLIQQMWVNLSYEDKLRSAIIVGGYILRCSSVAQKTFSATTRYMNGSTYVWQDIIASEGQYIEVSGYNGTTVAVNDYSTAHIGNAALYVL